MLNMWELDLSIDSFQTKMANLVPQTRDYIKPYFFNMRDSVFNTFKPRKTKLNAGDFIDNFPKQYRDNIIERALAISRNVKQVVSVPSSEMLTYKKQLVRYYIEWHRKIVLAFTIFVLFLVGAPLGAIIRKGGLGLPAVVSLLLFILHYVLSLSGEKLAKEFILTPFWGMWT